MIDYSNYTNDQLLETLRQTQAAECAIQRTKLAILAEVDRREGWKEDHAPSMTGWLTMQLGVGEHTAKEYVRVARKLNEGTPKVGEAFGEGRLSWDQVRQVTRFVDADTDRVWAEEAPRYTERQLRTHAERSQRRTLADSNDIYEHRFVRWWWEDGRVLRLSGRLPDDQGATVVKALQRTAQQIATGRSDSPDESFISVEGGYRALCADALAELAAAQISRDPDPDRATIVVHVDAALLTEQQDATDEAQIRETAPSEVHPLNANSEPPGNETEFREPASQECSPSPDPGSHEDNRTRPRKPHIEHGPNLFSETVHRLACDARIQLVFDGRDGTPVGVGRTQRTVPPWLARMVRERDQGCWICGRLYRTHCHHIIPWEYGGATILENLVELCPRDHRLVHEGGWMLKGIPGEDLQLVSPDGRTLDGPMPLHPDVRDRIMPLLPRRPNAPPPNTP